MALEHLSKRLAILNNGMLQGPDADEVSDPMLTVTSHGHLEKCGNFGAQQESLG